jgi:zinc protease
MTPLPSSAVAPRFAGLAGSAFRGPHCRLRSVVLLAALLLPSLPGGGGDASAQPVQRSQPSNASRPVSDPSIDLHIGYTQVVLRNGLTVLIHRDTTLPIMSVNLWYRVGSRDEPPGRTGFAHLFEHLMFEGSRNVPEGAFDTLLEDVGAHSNGSTSTDRTNYWINGPSNALELALWLEADRMGTLLDAVDQGKLDLQRAVVKNERREAYENRPYGLAWESLLELLYPEGHPSRWPVIGSMEDLANASLDDVRDFFRRWYAPNNAILAVAGNVNPDQVITLAERHFGSIPRGAPVERRAPESPVVLAGEGRRVLEDAVELPRLYMAWHSPAAFSEGDAELAVAAWVLGGGRSSRLHQRLVRELQVAQDVVAFQEGSLDGGIFGVIVTGRPGEPLEPLEALVKREIEALLGDEGLAPREVQGALNRIETDFVERVERVGGFDGKADLLNAYYMYRGDPGYLTRDLARFRRVTVEGVRRHGSEALLGRAGVVLQVIPRSVVEDTPGEDTPGEDTLGEDSLGTISADDAGAALRLPPAEGAEAAARATVSPPRPGPTPTLSLPTPQAFELSNGIPVHVVRRPGVPLVTLQAVFQGAPEAGLAGFTAAVMEEGTRTRTGNELSDAVDFLGASLSVRAHWDGVVAQVSAVRPRMPDAMELLSDVLRNPAFPEAEVDRLRRERQTRILQNTQDPRAVAADVFAARVHGEDHPYGAPLLGTSGRLDSLGRDALADYHRRVIRPSNAVLIVAGDITVDSARVWLEEAFGGWADEGPAIAPVGEGTRRGAPAGGGTETGAVTIHLVHRPGAPQSEIRVGRMGPGRDTDAVAALELLNSALGGSFTSRLNQNLREDKGFTYGVRSAFQMRRDGGQFVVATAVHTPVTAAALSEILAELEGVRGASPLTPDELARARNYMAVQLIERFETGGDLADRFGELAGAGRPLDGWSRLISELRSTTAEAVGAQALQWLSGPLVVVIVGDREEIEGPLRALGVGPVVLHEEGGAR